MEQQVERYVVNQFQRLWESWVTSSTLAIVEGPVMTLLVKSHTVGVNMETCNMDLSNTILIKINFAFIYYLYIVFSGASSVRVSKIAIQRNLLENLGKLFSFSQTLGLENA